MSNISKIEKSLPALTTAEFASALDSCAQDCQKYYQHGHDLIRLVESAGMVAEVMEEVESYIVQCKSQVKMMHEKRRPYTDCLSKMHKQFVELENRIDPKNAESPAHACVKLLAQYRQKRYQEELEERERIERNYRQAQQRLNRRKDLTPKQREEALKRSRKRYDDNMRLINLTAVDTETELVITQIDGYLDVIKCWWDGRGKNLPMEDLDRLLHPMLMFAKMQMRKGVQIKSENIHYVERAA